MTRIMVRASLVDSIGRWLFNHARMHHPGLWGTYGRHTAAEGTYMQQECWP